jgi:hypothetical protein
MQRSPTRLPFVIAALVGGLAALLLAVLTFNGITGSATARSSAFDTPSGMNLVFTEASARIVGSQALVQVRCEGPRSGICNGTATLRAAGQRHGVPFAVTGGTRSSLAVPLGSADALRGKRAVALARTVQLRGGYLRAREVLRLR